MKYWMELTILLELTDSIICNTYKELCIYSVLCFILFSFGHGDFQLYFQWQFRRHRDGHKLDNSNKVTLKNVDK